MAPFSAFSREAWRDCNGFVGDANDCPTAKGFAYARHELADGVEVDIYNLHFDAGRDPGDAAARRSQVGQLLEAFEARSAGRALLVAGDFNMKEDDEADLAQLLSDSGLIDACRSTACPNRAASTASCCAPRQRSNSVSRPGKSTAHSSMRLATISPIMKLSRQRSSGAANS